MLKPVTEPVPSRSPYLISPSADITDREFGWKVEVEAVRVGGSRKAPTFSLGTLRAYFRFDQGAPDLDDLIATVDGRYGLEALAKLNPNGTLWTKYPETPEDAADLKRILTEVTDAYPQVPDGWQGWYELV